MEGERRFRTGLFGYKKQDVYDFIEKLARDLEEQIKEKDDELSTLRQENKELKSKLDQSIAKIDQIENDRSYIANAIIKAEEKAKAIMDDAVAEAELKKQELQIKIQRENDKLKQVKQELHELKDNAINAVKKYESQLIELVGNEEMVSPQELEVTEYQNEAIEEVAYVNEDIQEKSEE